LSAYQPELTVGHLLRHAPTQSAQGAEAAIIDVAQDMLLRELHELGVLDLVAFKGGTALRKVYAGASGRFSTDLDFAVASLDDEPTTVASLLAESIAGIQVGPFRFDVDLRRGRHHIVYHADAHTVGSSGQLTSKLDVGPPPWLAPRTRPWVQLPIHNRYGGPLPELTVVALEENLAEKVARLNRRSPARDAYDLLWVARTPALGVDRDTVRHLAVLKSWVDQHGLSMTPNRWNRLPDARGLDVARWLTPRRATDFDDEAIGLLTAPPPDLSELGQQLSERYQWLAELTVDECTIAAGLERDRDVVLRCIRALPGARLSTCR
jgi:predicted nucleotidyltransferase component of viral defense system